jgi:hypothetical protein
MPGNDGVAPGIGRVVVALVQRISDDRPHAAGYSFAQQRRFAKAGWGGDEGELAVEAHLQPFAPARARHLLAPEGRNIEFGLQERCGHFTPRLVVGTNWLLIIPLIETTGRRRCLCKVIWRNRPEQPRASTHSCWLSLISLLLRQAILT